MSFINKILSEAFTDEIAKTFNYKKYNRDSDIDFEKLLKHYLPNAIFNKQADEDVNEAITSMKFSKGNTEADTFKRNGKLETVDLNELEYFQPLIYKKGTFSKNNPLQVVQIGSRKILLDGYHRVAEALVGGKTELQALVIAV